MSQPRPLKPLLNGSELSTHEVLEPVCEKYGARVYAKVGLKDVLPIEGSGISHNDFSFALKAHFDFVVYDSAWQPLFAVEYDGDSHREEEQKQRDEKKNALCERFGMPLLRIKSNYLIKKYRGLNLLGWFIEAWFAHDAFSQAQEVGLIPQDESFDPSSFLTWSDHKKRFPLWTSLQPKGQIEKLHRAGKCIHRTPRITI